MTGYKQFLLGATLLFAACGTAYATVQPSVAEFSAALAQDAQKAGSVPAPYGYVAEQVPAVLSENDVELYKWMFKKQRALARDEVAAKVSELQDDVLMGNLIAERLLHPSKRASYTDLRDWLEDYADQAYAQTIYKLAQQRRPKGNKDVLRQPSTRPLSLARYSDVDDRLQSAGEVIPDYAERSRLLNRLKGYRVNGDYEKSLALLAKPATQKALGIETWYEVSLTLSRSMLNHNYFEEAKKLAAKVAEMAPNHQPEALWVAGFSAYRGGQLDEAVKYFRRLVYTVPRSSSYYARAAWWTGRVYEEQRQISMSRVFMDMAAQAPLSFYGQLALERLGKTYDYSWEEPALTKADIAQLMQNPAIRRVIALVQIGEHGLAQRELKTMYESIPYDLDESLLALSIRLNLPNTSLTLARNLYERNTVYLSGLFPHSAEWEPYGGYTVDTALIFGIMRQESAFDPRVRSRVGARGLMQLMPGTAKFIRAKEGKAPYSTTALHNPKLNIGLGQSYIEYLNERLNGNLIYMIAAYNAGPGNVERWLEEDPAMGNDPALFIESIPFAETRKYVGYVMANYWMYQRRFEQETPTLTAMAAYQWPRGVMVASR